MSDAEQRQLQIIHAGLKGSSDSIESKRRQDAPDKLVCLTIGSLITVASSFGVPLNEHETRSQCSGRGSHARRLQQAGGHWPRTRRGIHASGRGIVRLVVRSGCCSACCTCRRRRGSRWRASCRRSCATCWCSAGRRQPARQSAAAVSSEASASRLERLEAQGPGPARKRPVRAFCFGTPLKASV